MAAADRALRRLQPFMPNMHVTMGTKEPEVSPFKMGWVLLNTARQRSLALEGLEFHQKAHYHWQHFTDSVASVKCVTPHATLGFGRLVPCSGSVSNLRQGGHASSGGIARTKKPLVMVKLSMHENRHQPGTWRDKPLHDQPGALLLAGSEPACLARLTDWHRSAIANR